jgi:hypothetical protein
MSATGTKEWSSLMLKLITAHAVEILTAIAVAWLIVMIVAG